MKKMSKNVYTELACAKIQPKRELVISQRDKGGFTLAQRILVEEGKKTTAVYMKNAIHVCDVEGLRDLRDALNIVLESDI